MNITIRQEKKGDLPAILELVERAFENVEESDHQEQCLVARLHDSDTFIPELSLVAVDGEARTMGYGSAVLLGHKDYYPRFGYRKAIDYGITFPFDAPQECCMVIELLPDGLSGVTGTVHYPECFQ